MFPEAGESFSYSFWKPTDGQKKFKLKEVDVVYNILDSNIVEKSKEPVEQKSKRHRLNLVSVGRLEYVKGYDRLIDAMSVLVNDYNFDVGLTLVGDGSQRANLEREAVEQGLTNNIFFVGSRSNPYPYVAEADVYICPSREEGFNIALLEAMTLGKPVIATNSAGPAEILDNGKYGILVENTINGLFFGILDSYSSQEKIAKHIQNSQIRSKQFAKINSYASIF